MDRLPAVRPQLDRQNRVDRFACTSRTVYLIPFKSLDEHCPTCSGPRRDHSLPADIGHLILSGTVPGSPCYLVSSSRRSHTQLSSDFHQNQAQRVVAKPILLGGRIFGSMFLESFRQTVATQQTYKSTPKL